MSSQDCLTQQAFAFKVADTRGSDIVPIWIERFALAVFATAFFGLVILNILKMDWIQRTGLGMGILGLSIFLAQTLYLNKTKADTDTSQQVDPKKPDVQQRSEGANSPNTNITGNNNTVTNTTVVHPPQPTFHEKSETVSFSLGENGMITGYAIESLRKKAAKPFMFGGKAPVILSMKGDTLMVEFSVWSGDEKPLIEVKDNEFTVRVPGCDKNSSAKALEIINANGVVLFQLIRKSSTNVAINGIFPSPIGLILAGPDGTITGARQSDLDHFRLKPIFKYPAWKYPGQYAD
jgi:hypothetical protein